MLHAVLGVAYFGLVMVNTSYEEFKQAAIAAQREIDIAEDSHANWFQTYKERVEWLSQCTDVMNAAAELTVDSNTNSTQELEDLSSAKSEARKATLEHACKQQ